MTPVNRINYANVLFLHITLYQGSFPVSILVLFREKILQARLRKAEA